VSDTMLDGIVRYGDPAMWRYGSYQIDRKVMDRQVINRQVEDRQTDRNKADERWYPSRPCSVLNSGLRTLQR
jgi:hypothetical protein